MVEGKISFEDYLNSILDKEEAKRILGMSKTEKENRLIVIAGRHGATGKSTLSRVLKKHGYRAVELQEQITINLNEIIKHPISGFGSLVD